MFNMRLKLSRKKRYYALTALAIGCILAGFMAKTHFSKTTIKPESLTVVRTHVIQAANTGQGYTYAGEVRGRYESQLAFQVTGKIIKRNVELGSVVSADEVLMQIDAKDIQQTVNSSSAQVHSAESQLRLAESNLKRYRQLLDNGAVSRAQYDQYANAYDAAVAGVRQASAQYEQGANQLDYSLLKADKAGVISSIAAEAGQVVSAGQTVITVVQDGEREIDINVPENRLEELKTAGQLKVTFWALPNMILDGKVREIAPMADQTTRTFKVRISLINPPPSIKLGMTAAVALAGGDTRSSFTIPLAALYQTGDTPAVWVVNNNILTLRPIKTGSFGNGTIQVLDGLQPDDQIVSAGVHKLKEGQRVKTTGDAP
ncbi:MAG TPA: efflux RND transporter periplasmic adaptor subunit [Methylomusa anaerophila]|uniref:Macrolide export protein MacA n=1 Tax=Methylomusa anaerophila TaxID=1930071 RepID=A0A348AQK1_9FIRM|nr:efflux RND transporter periplasmic adaptor subunit [Methylomusa anaerophila]BBB93349.1 macrolide export protein MacA [Methylomusa anaerophila]HML86821.1 efflux RND transporter periplasmic adaptor subunit [Methylomusa anaerophila]